MSAKDINFCHLYVVYIMLVDSALNIPVILMAFIFLKKKMIN